MANGVDVTSRIAVMSSGTLRFAYYVDTNGDLWEAAGPGWAKTQLPAQPAERPSYGGRVFAVTAGHDGTPRVFCINSNQTLLQLMRDSSGKWGATDVYASTKTPPPEPPVAESGIVAISEDGEPRVYFLAGGDGAVALYELAYDPSSQQFVATNLSEKTANDYPVNVDAFGVTTTGGSGTTARHIFFFSENRRLLRISYDGVWSNHDVTQNPAPLMPSPIVPTPGSGGDPDVYFIGANPSKVRNLYQDAKTVTTSGSQTDLTTAAEARTPPVPPPNLAAPSVDAIAATLNGGESHVCFTGTDGDLWDLHPDPEKPGSWAGVDPMRDGKEPSHAPQPIAHSPLATMPHTGMAAVPFPLLYYFGNDHHLYELEYYDNLRSWTAHTVA